MSGIIGIVNLNRAPIERGLLARMAQPLAARAPDAQAVWIQDDVALGSAVLRVTDESASEHQPLTLDGQVWITADARVDGRAELIQELRGGGREVAMDAPDVELILHAYHVWGDDCVAHLIGDWAFAIWDGRQHTLFCARDQFGVKPFYFASAGDAFLFSNTFECLLAHPSVPADLNDAAIADYVLFGFCQEPGATRFAQIHALPPAHCLTIAAGAPRVQRYWTLPVDPLIRHKHSREYVDQFRELFERAVEDRLRARQVSVLMSGGLDSSSIAATAQRVSSQQGTAFDLRAHTQVIEELIPHDEAHYARLVAEASGIPIYLTVMDPLPESTAHAPSPLTSPVGSPFRAARKNQLREISNHSRVVLTGLGGDPLLYPSMRYLPDLLIHRRFRQFTNDVGHYLAARGRLPPMYLRTAFKRRVGKTSAPPRLPRWLNPELVARLNLTERAAQFAQPRADSHPTRPEAYNSMLSPLWQNAFEARDAGALGEALEFRYPFFDLRLVKFMLAVPPVPWCVNKFILREAMREVLPEAVRNRPKTPLRANPLRAYLRQGNAPEVLNLAAVPQLERFVEVAQLQRAIPSADSNELFLIANVFEQAQWLWEMEFARRGEVPG